MRGRWITLLGLGIALGLLWWVFRGEDPVQLWGHIRSADAAMLLLAVALTTATFPVRAIRWRYLLAPARTASPFHSRFEAVCIGFMANNLLPRAGELARAYAYSRREPVSATTAFATLVVERFLDGVAILTLMLAALATSGVPSVDLPPGIVAGIRVVSIFLAFVLAGAVALVGLGAPVAGRVGRAFLPARWADSFVRLLRSFILGLESLRGWRLMLPALGWSLGVWTLQSLSLWVGFLAFDIRLGFDAALVTNGSVAIASAIPTPGFVGTFHAAVKLALVDLYGAAEARALAFAVGWHLGAFFPVTLVGLWYARRLGLSLREIGRRPESQGGAEDPQPSGGERTGDARQGSRGPAA